MVWISGHYNFWCLLYVNPISWWWHRCLLLTTFNCAPTFDQCYQYCKFDCTVSIDVEIFDICSKEMFCASRMVPFCFSMKLSCSDNVWCFKNSWSGDFNVWQVWLGIGSWMISCSLLLIISMEDKRKFRLSDGSVSATTVR